MSYDPYNINNGDSPMPYPNGATTNSPINVDGPNAFGPGLTQPQTNEGGGSFDFGSFLQNLLGGANSLLGGTNLSRLLAGYYAGNRAGDNMEEAATRYGQLGREARDWASPISNERRGAWDQRLQTLYDNPEEFLSKDPGYQSAKKIALDESDRASSIGRKFFSGEGINDRIRVGTDVANKYLQDEKNRLLGMAGYNFNPASGAQMMMEGGKLEQQALQAALAAKLYPLGLLAGGQGAPNAGGGGEGGGIGGLVNQIMGMFRGNNGGGGGAAPNGASLQNLLRMFGSSPTSISNLFPGGLNPPGLEELYGNVSNGNWDFSNLPGLDQPFDWSSFNLDQYGVTDIGDLGFFDP